MASEHFSSMSRTSHLDGDVFDPEVGWLVRITGLANATELNGQVGLICSFLPERQRYEVELLTSKQMKAIQARNLDELAPLEEVCLWRQLLEKVNGISSEELLLRQLNRLEKIQITVDILKKTLVGKSMNDLIKRLDTDKPQAAKKARQLVDKWRDQWRRETQNSQQKDSQESEKQSEKGSESEHVAIPPAERCLAIDASKLQCKNRRRQSRFLCDLHQRILDQDSDGKLDHGWFNDPPEAARANTNEARQVGAGQAGHVAVGASGSHGVPGLRPDHAILMNSNKPVADVKPMTGPEDAKKMVDTMRKVASESFRMELLVALDKSPRHCMLSFVQSGGVGILAKWLRKSEEARKDCLMVLQKLPVTSADLQKANLLQTVEAIQSEDKVAHLRENATALIERWKAAGFLEPPAKRPRLNPETPQCSVPVAPVAPMARGAPAAPVAPAATVAAAAAPAAPENLTQPRTPPLETLPAAPPGKIPRELESLDPRIAQVLLERPKLYSFLQNFRPVLENLNADSLSFLQRNLTHAQKSGQEQKESSVAFAGVSITISGLAEESSEGHIQQLLFDIKLQPWRVRLPRESCRKKSCGTAFVTLQSLEDATIAVDRLNGVRLHQKILTVDFLEDRGQEKSQKGRVKFKADSELWEVILFPPDESVEKLHDRLKKKDFQHQLTEHSQAGHLGFQVARRIDEMMEKECIRRALA